MVHKKTGIEMVLIPAGTYIRGLPTDEYPLDDEHEDNGKPCHQVILTRPFYIGKYEVTREEWFRSMGTNPSREDLIPAESKDVRTGRRPVDSISWLDAVKFCRKYGLRLPTEAEWEYACRAGRKGLTEYSELSKVAWWDSREGWSHEAGTKAPNAYGLHDMLGNVEEWCQDYYQRYDPHARSLTGPKGPSHGKYGVTRGGHFASGARNCHEARRQARCRDVKTSVIGFRVARDP